MHQEIRKSNSNLKEAISVAKRCDIDENGTLQLISNLFAHVLPDIQGQFAAKAESSNATAYYIFQAMAEPSRQAGWKQTVDLLLSKLPPRGEAILVGADSTSARFGTQFVSYDFFLSEVKGTD